MSTLRLGLYKLPAAEVVLIQTLLRLQMGRDTTARWALADHPPYDAVLVDATASAGLSADAARMAKSVLRITRVNDASQPDTIERPIRAEKLFSWLNKHSSGDAGATPAAAPAAAADARNPAQAPSEAETESQATVRHRLLRWPPSVVLRGDKQRIRWATLLSKRAFSANELALISGQPVQDCHAFLHLLRATGFGEAVPESVTAPEPARADAAPQPGRERGFAKGLISGLRRRLGL